MGFDPWAFIFGGFPLLAILMGRPTKLEGFEGHTVPKKTAVGRRGLSLKGVINIIYPITGLDRRFGLPELLDIPHMTVVK